MGRAASSAVARTLQRYSRQYRTAYTRFSNVLANAGEEARSTEEWVNILSGVALGGLTGGMFHSGHHMLHQAMHGREGISRAMETLGRWASKGLHNPAVEKFAEGAAHKGVHYHEDGVDLGLAPAAGAMTPEGVDVRMFEHVLTINNCVGCHGSRAMGDGPAAASLTPPPADLTQPRMGPHPSGKSRWQIILTGSQGTAMPAFGEILSTEQLGKLHVYLAQLMHGNGQSDKPCQSCGSAADNGDMGCSHRGMMRGRMSEGGPGATGR